MGCKNPVRMGSVCVGVISNGASLLRAHYHVMTVLGCQGGCIGGCLWARRAVGCAPSGVVVLMLRVVCSLFFCCRCAKMPKSLVWAREQSFFSRVFAVRVPYRIAVLLISGVLWSFRFLMVAMEGRTLASAVAMLEAVSLRVMPAWPMGMQTRSTLPQ